MGAPTKYFAILCFFLGGGGGGRGEGLVGVRMDSLIFKSLMPTTQQNYELNFTFYILKCIINL